MAGPCRPKLQARTRRGGGEGGQVRRVLFGHTKSSQAFNTRHLVIVPDDPFLTRAAAREKVGKIMDRKIIFSGVDIWSHAEAGVISGS
ncbi:MAG: hypothetical protein WCG66_07920 [bacterium]